MRVADIGIAHREGEERRVHVPLQLLHGEGGEDEKAARDHIEEDHRHHGEEEPPDEPGDAVQEPDGMAVHLLKDIVAHPVTCGWGSPAKTPATDQASCLARAHS